MESSEYLLVFLHSFVLEQEFGYMDRGEERQVIRKETIPKKGNRSELRERSEAPSREGYNILWLIRLVLVFLSHAVPCLLACSKRLLVILLD